MRIERLETPGLTGKKRQHFPYVLHWECPTCGIDQDHDLRDKYISNPEYGEVSEVHLMCTNTECDDYADNPATAYLRPNITLEIAVNHR